MRQDSRFAKPRFTCQSGLSYRLAYLHGAFFVEIVFWYWLQCCAILANRLDPSPTTACARQQPGILRRDAAQLKDADHAYIQVMPG